MHAPAVAVLREPGPEGSPQAGSTPRLWPLCVSQGGREDTWQLRGPAMAGTCKSLDGPPPRLTRHSYSQGVLASGVPPAPPPCGTGAFDGALGAREGPLAGGNRGGQAPARDLASADRHWPGRACRRASLPSAPG